MRVDDRTMLVAAAALLWGTLEAEQPSGHAAATAASQAIALASAAASDRLDLPPLDLHALASEDRQRHREALPYRFAVPHEVTIDPESSGGWRQVDGETEQWRFRITCPNAASINLGFSRFHLPPGARLEVRAADGSARLRTFTSSDHSPFGQLWTPALPANELVIELTSPRNHRNRVALELNWINLGYRGPERGSQSQRTAIGDHGLLQQRTGGARSGERGKAGESGECNVDVACPEAADWQLESAAVALYSVNGTHLCTAALINNPTGDQTPYLLAAKHCGVTTSIDHTVVVYWNYENSFCREPGTPESAGAGDGVLTDFSTGVRLRAAHRWSDFALLELVDPPDPSWNVAYAGWDRTSDDPPEAVTIHHPQAQEKRISFEDDPVATTSWGGVTSPGDGTHLRVADWDLGATEAGSNGAPMFNADHRIVGQLHGGFAACGNDLADWFGRLSHSWTGGGAAGTRLSDWLDPLHTGAMTTNTRQHVDVTLTQPQVSLHGGVMGGPFETAAPAHQLINGTETAIDYDVILPSDTVFEVNTGTESASSSIESGADAIIAISPASSAQSLREGTYEETILIRDLTHDMTFARRHRLIVGRVLRCAADVPVAIPDQFPAGVTSTIEVAENLCIGDLDVAVEIEHSFIGDLIVRLRGPDGHVVTLHNRTGNQQDDLVHVYDDSGADGSIVPHGPGALMDWSGASAQGEWTLLVSDVSAQDVGAIINWSLRIRPGAQSCEPILPYHVLPLDENPLDNGWTTTGDWSFGDPTGANGNPSTGATGDYVLAYAMDGVYPDHMAAPEHLSTAALDCSRLRNTQLRFQRWLGVEGSNFDHAAVEVSADGVNWTTVWSNPTVVIDESAWSTQYLDIAAVADHQPQVFIRWSMGPTDGDFHLHGWNLDDIEVWGVIDCPADVAPPQAGDGVVDVQDLLAVLAGWGDCGAPCPPRCAGDADGDCIIDVNDLLAVLGAWGACE